MAQYLMNILPQNVCVTLIWSDSTPFTQSGSIEKKFDSNILRTIKVTECTQNIHHCRTAYIEDVCCTCNACECVRVWQRQRAHRLLNSYRPYHLLQFKFAHSLRHWALYIYIYISRIAKQIECDSNVSVFCNSLCLCCVNCKLRWTIYVYTEATAVEECPFKYADQHYECIYINRLMK